MKLPSGDNWAAGTPQDDKDSDGDERYPEQRDINTLIVGLGMRHPHVGIGMQLVDPFDISQMS
jgi:hypothetical protein